MAELKYKKLPKKPKAGASLDALKAYEKKVAPIVAHNKKVDAQNKEKQKVRDRIAGIGRR